MQGYLDLTGLSETKRKCLITIAEAGGYEFYSQETDRDEDTNILGIYVMGLTGEPECCQLLPNTVSGYMSISRPQISIAEFLAYFAPEWATGVCTNFSVDDFWWVDNQSTFRSVRRNNDEFNYTSKPNWEHLQKYKLFCQNHDTPSVLKHSYQKFCKEFGGTISVDESCYTYKLNDAERYEFTTVERFHKFLNDYQVFANEYQPNYNS